MSRITKVLAAASVLGFMGLAACEDEAELDLGDAEVEVEEDGDINVNE